MIEVVETYFRKKARKKPWVFYGDNCHNKVSAETHTYYYRLRGSSDLFEHTIEFRYCSEKCAEKHIDDMLFSIFLYEMYPNKSVVKVNTYHYDMFKEWCETRKPIVGQIIYCSTKSLKNKE